MIKDDIFVEYSLLTKNFLIKYGIMLLFFRNRRQKERKNHLRREVVQTKYQEKNLVSNS